MKNVYTIGETATLLGVSTQTLRYYNKIGLVSPGHIDEKTGYRFYHYNQFHYIDRIKYLQQLGMQLEDIKTIMHSGRVDLLLPYLAKKKEEELKELKAVKERVKDIDWYIDYFTYLNNSDKQQYFYKVQFETRYVLTVPCFYKESLAEMEIRLATEKSKKEYAEENFRRQYGYKLNLASFMKGEFYPKKYFVYFREKPQIDEAIYEVLPSGEYLCFQTCVLKEDWDKELIAKYFAKRKTPSTILALEFEDNLVEYSNAQYEVQILL